MWLTGLRARLRGSWWGLILAEHDTEPAELLGGVAKVCIGIWLLLPSYTFTNNTMLYGDLMILPEWAWGCALIAIGVAHLSTLRDGDPRWRRWGAFAGFLTWCMLGGTFIHTQPSALVGPTFLLFAASIGWAYIRLGRLAGSPAP